MTLAGDVLKGTVPVLLAARVIGMEGAAAQWSIGLVALCAFMGHLFPLYLKGREGGKGVATAAGCFAALSPGAVLTALLVFVLFACMTSRVSVASLAASAFLPLALWEALGSGPVTACAGIAAVWIFIRHSGNIGRLMAGTEPKF
jgi:glycerol-3-phosphate acyltransferase PlsY